MADRYAWGGGEAENIFPLSSGPLMSPVDAYHAAFDSIRELQNVLLPYERQVSLVLRQIESLTKIMHSLQQHYDVVVEERDYIKRSLDEAEQRIAEVQNLLQRYTAVSDPVVASDGYTYEREAITNYLNECKKVKNVPTSQQTGAELTMLLFPNRTFKRFLEQLMDARQVDVRGDKNNSNSHHHNTGSNISGNIPGGRGSMNGQKSNRGDGSSERLHPCVRVYGYCNYKDACTYALYPYDACLSHLKGKCRFRSQCHERHVDFRGPMNQSDGSGESRNISSRMNV